MSEARHNSADKYIGIDLGTTHSVAACLDHNGEVFTISNAHGEPLTDSVVMFDSSGQVEVGRNAKRSILTSPDRVADRVKRDMGDQYYRRELMGKRMSPAEISALILKKVKQDAEAQVGAIAGAVITVPAHFDEIRRQATAVSGKMTELNVIDILNEPTAAAIAYAYKGIISKGGTVAEMASAGIQADGKRIAVYDLGGGTFDVTILEIAGYELTVLATDGDYGLGGGDWDVRIANTATNKFKEIYDLDPMDNPQSYQALLLSAEDAKNSLSSSSETQIIVSHQGKSITVDLTRESFEEMTADLLFRAEARLGNVLKQSGLTWTDIDEVIAVGGATRMPQVRQSIKKVTGKEARTSLSPTEAIAHGAAIHAAVCAIKGKTLWCDELPEESTQSAGPEESAQPASLEPVIELDEDDDVDIAIQDEHETLTRQENNSSQSVAETDSTGPYDPNVAEELRKIEKQDVNSHSLGIRVRTHDGKVFNSILIPRNSSLPIERVKRYGTYKHNQKRVRVRILQGESKQVKACVEVGCCIIDGLPPGLPKRSPIDVTFAYDGSGLLKVHAVAATSGLEASATIDRATGLNEDSVRRSIQKIKRISVL